MGLWKNGIMEISNFGKLGFGENTILGNKNQENRNCEKIIWENCIWLNIIQGKINFENLSQRK